jgi:hypothetical protein
LAFLLIVMPMARATRDYGYAERCAAAFYDFGVCNNWCSCARWHMAYTGERRVAWRLRMAARLLNFHQNGVL